MIKFRLWQRLAVVPHHCNAYARDLLIVECTVQWHYCQPLPPCYSGPSSCTVATPRTARDVDVAAHRVHSAPYAGMPAARTVLRPTPGSAATSPHEGTLRDRRPHPRDTGSQTFGACGRGGGGLRKSKRELGIGGWVDHETR